LQSFQQQFLRMQSSRSPITLLVVMALSVGLHVTSHELRRQQPGHCQMYKQCYKETTALAAAA
jgi:hypothetical protein